MQLGSHRHREKVRPSVLEGPGAPALVLVEVHVAAQRAVVIRVVCVGQDVARSVEWIAENSIVPRVKNGSAEFVYLCTVVQRKNLRTCLRDRSCRKTRQYPPSPSLRSS